MIEITIVWADGSVAAWVIQDDELDDDGRDLGDRIEALVGRPPDSIKA